MGRVGNDSGRVPMSAHVGRNIRPLSQWSDAEVLQAWHHPYNVGLMKNALRNEMRIRGLLCPDTPEEIDGIS